MALLKTIRQDAQRRDMTTAGILLICAMLMGAAAPMEQSVDEYHVKAAFLYNFARFVEWPATTFGTPHDPFVICVLGEDPFRGALTDVLGGKELDGRPFKIYQITLTDRINACHILFISSSERHRLPAILTALPASGILTVSEMDGFASAGGMINFTANGGRVRFQVNPRVAERAKLQISSRLLSLAQIVER